MSRPIALLSILLTLIFVASSIDTADAARFGGGRSSGSRAFMSKPATPPSSFMQQRTQAQHQQAAVPAQRPGMGGILGGLLGGALLGSLLFGNGGAMGGLFNLIILGGLAYLAFRLLSGLRRTRNNRQESKSHAATVPGSQWQTAPPDMRQWGMLRDDGNPSVGSSAGTFPEGEISQAERIHVPGNFDADEFIKGAKAAYTRLNASWDRRDLADIATFATAQFMDIIRAQARDDPKPGRTDILRISAKLMDVREDQGEQLASVFFDNVVSEDGGTATDVREIWHFVRGADGSGHWKLDGIQQMEY